MFDKILRLKTKHITKQISIYLNVQKSREDKFLRATKYKHYGSEGSVTVDSTKSKQPSQKKTQKKLKVFSFAIVSVLVATALIIPTTTLAPGVDAFEDSKAASYSVGNLDDFSAIIAENCVPVSTASVIESTSKKDEEVTEKTEETEKSETTKEVTEKQTEVQTEVTEETDADKTDNVQSFETEVSENVYESSNSSSYDDSEYSSNNDSNSSYVDETSSYEPNGSYLISISNPDYSYSPAPVSLSEYDRAKLERLVMGEAGSIGFNGCALVAQAIRDAMNRSNTSSIDTIISTYQYYAPTNKEPNQDVKNAVSYIFDQNGSAVQHRILVFYTGTSGWHETQNYITTCGNVRFFDMYN